VQRTVREILTELATNLTENGENQDNCSINTKARETHDDLEKDGKTNCTLRIKEKALRLTLQSA
jgi:hypothetical protein